MCIVCVIYYVCMQTVLHINVKIATCVGILFCTDTFSFALTCCHSNMCVLAATS